MRLEALAEVAPVLVFGIGNPSRGDDAIGPAIIERLSRRQAAGGLHGVDMLTDFQLQPEHALDLRGRTAVILVDASADAGAPFALSNPSADAALAHSTHSTSPQQLLAVYARLYGAPPTVQLLAVRGYRFELGAELTTAARTNLDAAVSHLVGWLRGAKSARACED
jgi:hydrogenase maturation protease